MQEHYWEKATGYEVKIYKGFTELKSSAFTASASNPVLDYRQKPDDKQQYGKISVWRFQTVPVSG
jgi:type III restriction enzyme